MPTDTDPLTKLAGLLEPAAPTLAHDLNSQTSRVIKLLSTVLLSKANAPVDDIINIVQTADAATKIACVEELWKTSWQNNGAIENSLSRFHIDQAKRSDAATRWLAYGTTIGFFAIIFSIIFINYFPNPKASDGDGYKETLLTLLGIVGTGWAGIITFYFGSSVGSRQQSGTLQDISRMSNTRL